MRLFKPPRGQSRKLNLDHVEATRRLGSKEELKLLREGKRLIGRQVTIEGMAGMRIEIVLHQAGFSPPVANAVSAPDKSGVSSFIVRRG